MNRGARFGNYMRPHCRKYSAITQPHHQCACKSIYLRQQSKGVSVKIKFTDMRLLLNTHPSERHAQYVYQQ